MNIRPKRQALPSSLLHDQDNPHHYGARGTTVACNDSRSSNRNILVEHFVSRTLLATKRHIYEQEPFQEDKILSLLVESAVSNCPPNTHRDIIKDRRENSE